MKNRILTIALTVIAIMSFCGVAIAEDITYKASMTGIDCDGCKKKIIASLAKIDGVKQIRVSRAKKQGMHQLTIVTDGDTITKEQAVAAISHAEHYKIVSWASK